VLLEELRDLRGCLVGAERHVFAVAVEGHRDRRVPGERLDAFWVGDGLGPDCDAGVTRLVQRDGLEPGRQPLQLRRLAIHDDALFGALLGGENGPSDSVIDPKAAALARVAATIAVDAASSSIQHVVALALAAGATSAEIVATLEAVTPVTGAARVVSAAPKIALALGYDVEDALEQLDP
jgi:4-carboxymuconolactone decarboxylase